AIAAAGEEGLALQLDTRLTRQTVERLPRTAGMVSGFRPVLWNVVFPVPVGRVGVEQQLAADSCERVLHFLSEWSERVAVAVTTTAAPAYRRVLLQRDARR